MTPYAAGPGPEDRDPDNGAPPPRKGGSNDPPIEDLFDFEDDPVDFMSAESFPASDPPPPQSASG